MGWTADQQAAIAFRGENLLLAAAAGSGKTTVLVERVLSLIEEGVDVDEMLIVTFSRAAASDMKRKLTERLAARAGEAPRAAEQLERVERASISTLHAFCIEVLRGHFEAAGVDPAFRVLDDAENRQLEARAMEEALERACAAPTEDLLALAYGRDVRALGALARAVHAFSQERPDPEAWLNEALVELPAGDGERWRAVLREAALEALDEGRALLRYALELVRAPRGPAAYAEALEEDLVQLDAMAEMAYEPLQFAAGIFTPARLKPLRVKAEQAGAQETRALAEQVKALREEVKKRLERLKALMPPLEGALEDMRLAQPALRGLRALAGEYGRALAALKADRSALTFNDLEHGALSALSDPGVAESLRTRYQYVFVDEYQDVSDLQEALIARVARPDRLFMVGDVKQSIYRFRQAEPTLFIDKYRRYGRGEGGRLIALRQNFRSRASVLALVNRVFERAMSGARAEVEYDEAARLRPGAAYEGSDPQAEIHLLAPGEGEEEAQSEEEAELTGAQKEGRLVATRIRALLGSPLYDPKFAGLRPVRPGDIAVLARTRAGLSACALMLREAGIPAYADVSEGYFDALEVRLMLETCQAVENRRRDFAMLAALRSPIVGLSSTQLARVRAACPGGSFRDAMLAYEQREDELAGALIAFEERLDRWRMLSRALPLPEWMDLMLRETGLYAYAGGMAGGAARQGNLDLLCAYASQFEAAQSGGLTGFLDYVREVKGSGGDMGAAHVLGEGDDVVRLMTAHKSKGLEFPIVFAVQMGRPLAARRAGGELITHRALGAGLYFNDPVLGTRRDTLARLALSTVCEAEALEEEKRILYVLMTRAKDRLILVGSERAPDKAQVRWQAAERAPMRPGNFLDMIMPALPAPGEAPEVEVFWHESIATAPGPAEPDAPEEDAEDWALGEALSWRYPHEDEAFVPVKLTASGLTRELVGARAVPALTRRPRFMAEGKMSASERGTLIHAALSALELAPLRALGGEALRAEIARQIENLRARNVLSAPVDAGPIAAFFEREVGRRLLFAPAPHREWAFNLRMSAREALELDSDAPVVVQGVIDCCFMESGGWVLLDYKTDRLDDEEALLSRYRAQLSLYARALARITQAPVSGVYLCLLGAGREIAL